MTMETPTNSSERLAERDFFRNMLTQLPPSLSSTRHHDNLNELDDMRIVGIKPLVPPQILMEDLPVTAAACLTILDGRSMAEDIITGKDDRLIVVVGPCSIHDTKAALAYAERLKAYADKAREDLHIIMRVYFEKPRTTVGWKGKSHLVAEMIYV
jgi:3-deoxy-7-phosphoheptulonate synthase